MSPPRLPEAPRARLRWAIREGLVIAGIVLFWLGVAVVVAGAFSLLTVGLHLVDVRATHLLADVLRRTAVLWPAMTAVAVATTGLYVVVRAGTLLIDHHRAGGD